MDFLGMGPMELVVIMVIGLLVLGPQRMVKAAQGLGRFLREVQRSWHETVDAVALEPGPKESPSPSQAPPKSSPPGQVDSGAPEPQESTDQSSHRESQG